MNTWDILEEDISLTHLTKFSELRNTNRLDLVYGIILRWRRGGRSNR